MKILLKGLLRDHYPEVPEWNDPSVRTDENGNEVVGRPSVGYGDANKFTYAGRTLDANPWTTDMLYIKKISEAALLDKAGVNKEFTFCLAGYYPEANGIPYHSDTVPTVDDWVASWSFGGSRVFGWKEYDQPIKTTSNSSLVNFDNTTLVDEELFLLEHGDLMLFNGQSQMNSMHNVPDLLGTQPRINLTFRTGL